MPRLLLVALACALLTAPGLVRADDATDAEEIPWWAQADYPDEPVVDAAPNPADLPADLQDAEDTTWWAGGPDAVVALSGSEPVAPPTEFDGTVEEPEAFWAEPPAALADSEGDDGRNPLFGRAEGERAAGHRAGEAPTAAEDGDDSAGTTEALPGEDEIEVEERDRRDGPSCNRWAKQIVRYEADLEYARDHEQDKATEAMEAQVERLQAKWDAKCAPPPGPSKLMIALHYTVKAAKLAAKVARMMYGSPF